MVAPMGVVRLGKHIHFTGRPASGNSAEFDEFGVATDFQCLDITKDIPTYCFLLMVEEKAPPCISNNGSFIFWGCVWIVFCHRRIERWEILILIPWPDASRLQMVCPLKS